MFDAFWIFWCSNTQIVLFFLLQFGITCHKANMSLKKELGIESEPMIAPWICDLLNHLGSRCVFGKNSSRSRCFFLHSKKQWLRTEDAIKPCWDFFVRKVYIIDECMSFLLRNLNLAKIMKNLFDHSIYVDVFGKILGLPLFRNTPKSCFDFCFGG